MTIRPAYRARVFGPDDVTILSPAATAPHGDPFLVATLEGVSDGYGDYHGYLDFPKGRNGRLDVVTLNNDTGTYTWRILDPRVAPGTGSHDERFATGLLGDASGREQMKGLLWVADESLDGGGSWGSAPFCTHRISDVRLEGGVIEVDTRDASEDLNQIDIFTGDPDSSVAFVAREQLIPVGLTAAYGPFAASGALAGTMVNGTGTVQFSRAASQDQGNIITAGFDKLLWGGAGLRVGNAHGYVADATRLRARVTQTSGGSSGTTADYAVTVLFLEPIADGHWRTTGPIIQALPGGTAVPANGVSVLVRLYAVSQPGKSSPLLVDSVHLVTLFRLFLEGKFSRTKADGSLRATPFDAAAFAAFEADDSWPSVRFPVTAPAKLWEFVKKSLCQPHRLGYDVNGAGEVVPLDLRMPDSLSGLPVFTDANLAGVPKWSTSRSSVPNRVEFTYYLERRIEMPQLARDAAERPTIPPGLIESVDLKYIRPNVLRDAPGDRAMAIDSIGTRAAGSEMLNGVDRRAAIEAQIAGMTEDLATQFAAGALKVSIPMRREDATAAGLRKGAWFLLSSLMLPDPATNRRNGQRLYQVEEITPNGTRVDIQAVDAGISTTATAPTGAALGQESGNERHGITVPVVLNADDHPVRIEVLVTDTGVGSAPADDDPAWLFGARVIADGTATLRNYPSNSRVWVHYRSEPADGFQQPSAWASPATAYIDTDAVPAPSGLAITVDGVRALAEWTVGDANLPVEIRLVTPDTDPPAKVMTLPYGSSRWQMEDLDAASDYKIQVLHPDGHGGFSDPDEDTFTTAGSATGSLVAAAPGGLAILVGIPFP